MGICPLNTKKEGGWKEAEWLVIPFDRPVQVGACPIVGQLSSFRDAPLGAAPESRGDGYAVRSPPTPCWSRSPPNPCGHGGAPGRIPSSSRSAVTTCA